jgi:hypothetical protein
VRRDAHSSVLVRRGPERFSCPGSCPALTAFVLSRCGQSGQVAQSLPAGFAGEASRYLSPAQIHHRAPPLSPTRRFSPGWRFHAVHANAVFANAVFTIVGAATDDAMLSAARLGLLHGGQAERNLPGGFVRALGFDQCGDVAGILPGAAPDGRGGCRTARAVG